MRMGSRDDGFVIVAGGGRWLPALGSKPWGACSRHAGHCSGGFVIVTGGGAHGEERERGGGREREEAIQKLNTGSSQLMPVSVICYIYLMWKRLCILCCSYKLKSISTTE
jgi:hypothetical protein